MGKYITLTDLTKEDDLFKLREYIRELYDLTDKRFQEVTFSATPTFDMDQSNVFLITLTANITGITLKHPDKGRIARILFKQGGVGAYTITGWPATVKLEGAAAIGGDAVNEYATITLVYDGTNYVELGRTGDVK